MRWARFAVVVLVAALLQASWINVISATRFNVAPDLLLIVMIFFAINCNLQEAIICSFAIGLAADITAAGFPMGPRIISFGFFGTALAYLHRVIAIRKMHQETLAIFLTGLMAGGLSRLLAGLAGYAGGPGDLRVLLGTSIYSAVVGPFLFLLLDRLMGIKGRHRGRD
jgi:rod shape-determining protein MreD